MKAAIPLLLAVFAFATVSLADDKPRTIVTRDHQVYEKAVIVDRGEVSVTIEYDAGVVRVALENLPADIQKELGYISKTPDVSRKPVNPPPPLREHAKAPPEVVPAATAAAPTPTPMPNLVNPTPVKVEPLPVPTPTAAPAKPFTQTEANALYGLKETAILKKWGKPLRIEKFTDLNKRKVEVLVYDEDETTGTKFWIYEKDGFVSGGLCKGKPIRSPSQQAKFDAVKAAGN